MVSGPGQSQLDQVPPASLGPCLLQGKTGTSCTTLYTSLPQGLSCPSPSCPSLCKAAICYTLYSPWSPSCGSALGHVYFGLSQMLLLLAMLSLLSNKKPSSPPCLGAIMSPFFFLIINLHLHHALEQSCPPFSDNKPSSPPCLGAVMSPIFIPPPPFTLHLGFALLPVCGCS